MGQQSQQRGQLSLAAGLFYAAASETQQRRRSPGQQLLRRRSRSSDGDAAAGLDGEGFLGSNVDGDGCVVHEFVTAATSSSNGSFCSSGSPKVGCMQRRRHAGSSGEFRVGERWR